ncbi:MAG TPA: hypothetical protein VIG74_07325 [Alphaproteobacteria bacterium]|jgi:hypothetical protein
MVKLVTEDFHLASVPTLDPRNRLKSTYADYHGEKHRIRVREKYWRLNFVLHELAHAIDEKINGNCWAAHGPSFMRTLLAIVEDNKRWFDTKELEASAAADGIAIAPAVALPLFQSPKPAEIVINPTYAAPAHTIPAC